MESVSYYSKLAQAHMCSSSPGEYKMNTLAAHPGSDSSSFDSPDMLGVLFCFEKSSPASSPASRNPERHETRKSNRCVVTRSEACECLSVGSSVK